MNSDLKPKTAPPKEGLGKIALIDDEGDLLEIVSDALAAAGFTTVSFTSPTQALRTLSVEPVDLVISDYRMPEMDGLTLIRKLHDKNPDLPVILVSGHLHGPLLVDGLFALLEKPFEMEFLVKTAMLAVQRYQTTRVMNRAFDLLMYHFSDLEMFLEQLGRQDVREIMKTEMRAVVELRSRLSTLRKKIRSEEDKS